MRDIKSLFKRVGVVGAMLALVTIAGSKAFFSDRETSVGNVLADGGIDLKIDNSSWYNGEFQQSTSWTLDELAGHLFFDFKDLKPGDEGEDTVSFHVRDNDAWLCANVTLTESADNGITEPEGEDGDVTDGKWVGELDEHVEFIFWADDGDNVLETDENILLTGTPSALPQDPGEPGIDLAIADSVNNVFTGLADDPLKGSTVYYIGKAWCFGDINADPVTADLGVDPSVDPGVTCDGSLETNITQTDSIKGDVSFTAFQARDLSDFVCGQPIPTPKPTPTPLPSPSVLPSATPSPSPVACTEVFVSQAVSTAQGTRKDGSSVLATRSDPTDMLGTPDGPAEGTFYSLGFNGVAVLKFGSPVLDVVGVDLSFHEITNGRDTYPLEKANVAVSSDNVTYFFIGEVTSEPTGDGVEFLDFSPTGLGSIQYVKLTNTTDPAIHGALADGYDVDAVDGKCGTK